MQESSLKTNFLGRDGFRWWIGQIPQESAHGGQINGAGWGNRFKVRIMGYHPYDLTELSDEDLPWAQCLLSTTSGTGAGNNATSVKISPGDVVFGFFLDTDNAQTPVIMGCFGRTSQVLTSNKPGPFQPFTGYTDKVKKPNGTLKPDQTNEQNSQFQKSPRNVSPSQAQSIGDDEISYSSVIGDKIQLANTVKNTTVNKISTEVSNLLNKIKAPAIFTNIGNEINRVTEKIQAICNGLVGNMVNGLFTKLTDLLKKGLKLLFDQVYALVLAATLNPVAAYLAGVAAQTAMVQPVNVLQQAIPCVSGAIIAGLGSVVKKILTSAVDNVDNFVSCAGDQFTGALINSLIGRITSGLESAIGGVQTLLKFFSSFSVGGFLQGSIDSIKGLVGMFDCNQSKGKSRGIVDQWIIGQGPSNVPAPDFGKILETAKIAKGIGQISSTETVTPNDRIIKDNFLTSITIPSAIGPKKTTFEVSSLFGMEPGRLIIAEKEVMLINSFGVNNKNKKNPKNEVTVTRAHAGVAKGYPANSKFNILKSIPKEWLTKEIQPSKSDQEYGSFDIFGSATKNSKTAGCYTGAPTSCGAPTVTIFGGGGSGCTAIPLLGAIVGGTGSIIGVKVTNSGSGYTFPPFVEISDNCNQGYGVVARSTINDAGQVDSIYIVSEGENYPTGDVYENTTVIGDLNGPQTGSFVARNYTVKNVIIQNPGQKYDPTDTATDQFGNEYPIEVFEGYINSIQPINSNSTTNRNINTIIVNDLPIITIKSETGSGAILRPILDIQPAEFQGEVQQVIDCVT